MCHTWKISIGNSSPLLTVLWFLQQDIAPRIKIKLLTGILIFNNFLNVPWIEAKNL